VFLVRQMIRAGVDIDDVVMVYCSIIRSILEYASPVWHPGLTVAQTNEIESVQRRCLKIIYPALSYDESLLITHLDTLANRRDRICRELFEEIKHPQHVLNSLLIKRDVRCEHEIRSSYPFVIPRPKTNRFSRSFIPFCLRKRF